jgi:hypothetical protein
MAMLFTDAGMNPTYEETILKDGVLIRVTPAKAFCPDYSAREVLLTKDQYVRYVKWRNRKVLIQEALPELSDEQRETLMTGLVGEDFIDPDEDA